MKQILLILIIPGYLFSQTHYIDTNVLYMSGNNINSDIAINTFYNSIDTCNISWNIIYDSMRKLGISYVSDCHNIGSSMDQSVIA